MPLQLKPRIEQTFQLVKSDEKYESKTPTTVTIKQATQGEHEKRQDLYATLHTMYGTTEGSFEMVQRWNMSELHRHEARLTLVDCNIDDEDGKPLFTVKKDKKGHTYIDMSEPDFNEAWAKLPVDVAEEIHDKVLELNPLWGARGEQS